MCDLDVLGLESCDELVVIAVWLEFDCLLLSDESLDFFNHSGNLKA
jgi:hypothetical protein